MALNWYLTLRNLAKSDAKAAELFELLKKAETDVEKENAKIAAQAYIGIVTENATIVHTEQNSDSGVTEDSQADSNETESVEEPESVVADTNSVDMVSDSQLQLQEDTKTDEEVKTDLSQPAFTPRLAKCGITREEELFLHGIYVRKMTRKEKLLLRRSIYQKKNQRNAQIQAELKAKRMAQREKDLNDPEKIKFHQERKLIAAVIDALINHKNMVYIFSEIDGLTPEVLKELLKNPANVSAIQQTSNKFIENFKKAYGE